MTDVAAAFPNTQRSTVLRVLRNLRADPVIIRWAEGWLSDRKIEMTLDGITGLPRSAGTGIPQGSPVSPVLFRLVCAAALKQLPMGASFVDDCSWFIRFTSQADLQAQTTQLLDSVRAIFAANGLTIDTDKLEAAFFARKA